MRGFTPSLFKGMYQEEGHRGTLGFAGPLVTPQVKSWIIPESKCSNMPHSVWFVSDILLSLLPHESLCNPNWGMQHGPLECCFTIIRKGSNSIHTEFTVNKSHSVTQSLSHPLNWLISQLINSSISPSNDSRDDIFAGMTGWMNTKLTLSEGLGSRVRPMPGLIGYFQHILVGDTQYAYQAPSQETTIYLERNNVLGTGCGFYMHSVE